MGRFVAVLRWLAQHRMDSALVSLLFVGSLGFGDGLHWLQPAAPGAPKAYAVVVPPQATPRANPLPNLAIGNAPPANLIGGGPLPTNRLRFAPSGGGTGVTGGGSPGGQLGAQSSLSPTSPAITTRLSFGAAPAAAAGGFATRSAPAVPEPSTWALIILGMGAIAGMGWMRNRRELLAA